jgi:hypothetical protein
MTDLNAGSSSTDLRTMLIAACRELTRRGLTYGTSGNVSVRCDERRFFVSPRGMDYGVLRADDVPLMDLDGRWFGRRRPSSEWRFHRDIFRWRHELAQTFPPPSRLPARSKTSGYNTVRRCPWEKSVFSMTQRCAAWSRSSALTGNRMRRTPISSLAEPSPDLSKEVDHAGGRHTFHLPNPRH